MLWTNSPKTVVPPVATTRKPLSGSYCMLPALLSVLPIATQGIGVEKALASNAQILYAPPEVAPRTNIVAGVPEPDGAIAYTCWSATLDCPDDMSTVAKFVCPNVL